jgi:UDP-N-acetyl-D-glucosamine dehydrogenase
VTATQLRERIRSHEARIVVVGLGYVGLPLAISFAREGFHVTGIDVDASKVAALERGNSYILDVPSDAVRDQRAAGRFAATTDADALRDADVIFVSVPTPFDRAKQPDLRFVISAAESLAPRLRPGQLVILESTTYPGTTDEIMRPILERSGLVAGRDFFLAFSPERIDPGNRSFGIANTPKVVGGVDPTSTDLAADVLSRVVTQGSVHRVSSAKAAELTKLLENTFRAVNIALVNELAMLCDRMGIDIWEVVDAASTKPYGFMPFFPGPGVGGHCIPVDPYYLSWKAREFDFHTKFIELAAETNLEMPFYTADRIRRLLSKENKALHGAKVLVLGAAFKKDIDDARNSTAIRVMEILRSEGAHVTYHDPYIAEIRLSPSLYTADGKGPALGSVDLTPDAVAAADVVAILVGHSSVDHAMVLRHARAVFDAVNATRGLAPLGRLEKL